MPEMPWPLKPLVEIAEEIKDGTHGTFRRVPVGIPFLSAKNIGDDGRVHWDDSDDRVSDLDHRAITASFSPRRNDLLVTIVGTLGRRALFSGDRVAFQRSVAFVRPKSHVYPRFLFHVAGNPQFHRQLVQRSNATAQAGLYLGELAKVQVPIPPNADEQRRIASVLDTVDAAIEKTAAVIAKLKQVRTGLLHDLLTRGLDANGQLRDPRRHPNQFKPSPLGLIPKKWDVFRLSNVIEKVMDFRGRTPLKLGLEWGGGAIPALSANNVEMGRINFGKETYYGSEKLYRRWMTHGDVQQGDVLITMEAPLGNVAQIADDQRYILSQRVILLRPHRDLLLPDYLAMQMMGHRFQKQLVKRSSGSTAVGIQRAQMEQIAILVPREPSEQAGASVALQKHDKAIAATETELAKIQQLKSGLMSHLLKGHVRVPEHLEAPVIETGV